jgi:hypothetical protein
MADQSRSACLQQLFEPSLLAYEAKTGIKLAEHSLAVRFQHCDDVTSFLLLQGQIQAFSDTRQNDRIINSLKTIIVILSPLSSVVSFVDPFTVVRPKVIMARSTISDLCLNRSHLRKHYRLLSPSYSTYVSLLSYAGILVMFKQTRWPTTQYLVLNV